MCIQELLLIKWPVCDQDAGGEDSNLKSLWLLCRCGQGPHAVADPAVGQRWDASRSSEFGESLLITNILSYQLLCLC